PGRPNSPVTVSVSDKSIVEGNSGTSLAVFTVSLSQASLPPVSFEISTQNGSALSGSEYSPIVRTLPFAPGQTSSSFGVSVLGDTRPEPNEDFFVNLSWGDGAVIADPQGAITIANDETATAANIVDVSEI